MTKIEDIFSALSQGGVKYLLIGGMASILYGAPRTTVDIDIAIDPALLNVRKTISALRRIGLTCDTDDLEKIIAQGGVTFSNSLSLDVLTDLPGKVIFKDAWKRRMAVRFRGVSINLVSKSDQIKLLRTVGRSKDLEDAEILQKNGRN